MEDLSFLYDWLYSDGNILMFGSKAFILLFVIETFAYIISLLVGMGKAAMK